MRPLKLRTAPGLLLACALAAPAARAADADDDALALQSAPTEPESAASNLKAAIELALGSGKSRATGGNRTLRRASLDLVYATRLSKQWRFTFSDRLDSVEPDEDSHSTVNSLRELYLGWQDEAAQWVVEFGRINLRQGPGLGYNPTDFFRDGALRVSTTVNPFLVREYRIGSLMLRTQRLWSNGSLSLALSPKVSAGPATGGLAVDLGATNNRNRALATLGTNWSSSTSSLVHLYAEEGGTPRLGASVSSLVSDALVVHAEGSWGKEPDLIQRALGQGGHHRSARVVAGGTFTTAGKLSLSAEAEYNGFALTRSAWDSQAAADPAILGHYLRTAERLQDNAARLAVLVYAKQSDAFVRNVDLTLLLRSNVSDHSALVWAEIRYRAERADIAFQWLRYAGRRSSEYGLNPYSSTVQLVGTLYF